MSSSLNNHLVWLQSAIAEKLPDVLWIWFNNWVARQPDVLVIRERISNLLEDIKKLEGNVYSFQKTQESSQDKEVQYRTQYYRAEFLIEEGDLWQRDQVYRNILSTFQSDRTIKYWSICFWSREISFELMHLLNLYGFIDCKIEEHLGGIFKLSCTYSNPTFYLPKNTDPKSTSINNVVPLIHAQWIPDTWEVKIA
jgi:hypothetical protein